MRKYVFIAAIGLVVLLASCKREKPAEGPQPTPYETAMTNKDTVAVTQLIDQFFGYLEGGRLTDAVAMLYKMDDDNPTAEPQLLDNEQLKTVMNAYRVLMPIRGHRIDYIKFNQAYDNEVKVTVILEEAHDGMPEMTSSVYLKPYDYLTSWRLCTLNSNSGDRRIISNEQADSMQQRYSEELEQKSAK